MAYRAEIEIGVKGGKEISALQDKVERLTQALDAINTSRFSVAQRVNKLTSFQVAQEQKLIVQRQRFNDELRESVRLAVEFQQRIEASIRAAQSSRAVSSLTLTGSTPAGLLAASPERKALPAAGGTGAGARAFERAAAEAARIDALNKQRATEKAAALAARINAFTKQAAEFLQDIDRQIEQRSNAIRQAQVSVSPGKPQPFGLLPPARTAAAQAVSGGSPVQQEVTAAKTVQNTLTRNLQIQKKINELKVEGVRLDKQLNGLTRAKLNAEEDELDILNRQIAQTRQLKSENKTYINELQQSLQELPAGGFVRGAASPLRGDRQLNANIRERTRLEQSLTNFKLQGLKVTAAETALEKLNLSLNRKDLNTTEQELKLQKELLEDLRQELRLVRQISDNRKGGLDGRTRAQRVKDATGSALIGGAFPLLFGQGGGAAVGGAAGGFGGGLLGGQFGFGLSLVGTQLGTAVDQFIGKITTLAGSLESTESIFSALEEAGFKVNDVTKEIAASYEEAGLFADAYQLAIDELNKKLGDDGAAKLQAYQDELNRVNDVVEELSSDLMMELLPALTGTLRLILGLKESFDTLAESPLFRLLATIGKNVAFLKPDLIVASAFAQNAQRLGAADGDVRTPASVTRKEESEIERRIKSQIDRDRVAGERLYILDKELDLAKAGNDILNKNVQTAKQNIIQETYLAALRKKGLTDKEKEVAETQRQIALQKLGNQITQAENRAAAKAQSESDRAAKRAQAEAERAAKRAKQEEERLQRRLTKLRLERDQIAKVTQFKDRIAAAEADSDKLTAARIKGEQRIFEIEQKRLGRLIGVTEQREIDEINITAAASKLAAMRDTERDMAEIQRQGTQEFQNIIENLQSQLDIATATTREEAEQLRIQQEMEGLKGKGFSDEQLNRIKLLKENLNKANQPLNKFIIDSTKQLNDLEQVAVNVASGIGNAIGNSLNNAISGLIEGSTTVKEVFADMLKSIGQVLVQEGTKMIATYIAIGIAKAFAGLGNSAAGTGKFAEQSSKVFDGSSLFGQAPVPFKANGGPVRGGQPYMVGERGPELFVPGTDGGVMRNEDMRQLMGRSPVGNAPAMNFTFETTNIGGQEFVSREQLEAAMATTRRQAANDGAKRGMNMTLDRMQNSPRTRARVGIS